MRRLIVLAALVAVVASACKIETNFGVVINADGSGTIKAEVGMDDEAQQFLLTEGGDPFEGNDLSEVPGAVQTTETRGDLDYWIIEVPVADVTQIEEDVTSAENSLLSEFDVEVTDTLITVRATAAAEDAIGEDTEGFDPSVLEDSLSFNVRITLPGKILEHNADSREGNTLIWAVPILGGTLDVQAQSDPSQPEDGGGGGGIPMWVWIAIAAAVVAGAVYYFMQQQKKAGASPAVTGEMQAAAPAADDPFAVTAPPAPEPPPPPPANE
ncbi:MAG: hypothetical protein WD184_01235 [Acidimicrobiia bacterium]